MTQKNYQGILFLGQAVEMAGRGIGGFRLRTAAKKAGFDILIIDYAANLSGEEVISIIKHHLTDSMKFIGFSTSWIEKSMIKKTDCYRWYSKNFFSEVKQQFPSLHLISGGHDYIEQTEILEFSDFHFHGFSDNTFVEFLKMLNGIPNSLTFEKTKFKNAKIVDSNISNPVTSPDEIETVLEVSDKFLEFQPIPIELSRGCIFRCSFCRHPFQGKKEYDSYQRTSQSIANELKRNYELFGTYRYTIMDDTFNDSIEKIDRLRIAIDLANLPKFESVAYIRPELLVTKPEMITMLSDIGLKGAFLGIESFQTTARKSIGKGLGIEKILESAHRLSKNGALIHASFIIGLPGDTEEDILKTQEFLISNNSPFKSWYWQGLGIRNTDLVKDNAKSIFDKKFKDYGYFIPTNSNLWANGSFTQISATKLADKLNNDSAVYSKLGGWRLAGAWQLGMSETEINSEKFDFKKFTSSLVKASKDRSNTELQNLLNTQ
jgi:hypothetical protein